MQFRNVLSFKKRLSYWGKSRRKIMGQLLLWSTRSYHQVYALVPEKFYNTQTKNLLLDRW